MRTRFPPSPTGFLHIGGLRTALYSYLIARQTDGKFILRIEDTDQTRAVEGAVENILRTLHWAGLDPDEGVMLRNNAVVQEGAKGPYIQSERFEVYKKYAEELLEKGNAYYAFDTKEELDRMREEESKAGNAAPKYDASVRMRMKNSLTLTAKETQQLLDDGMPYAIRMKVPEGNVVRFTDDIRGNVEFRGIEIDDQILIKSDGFPTYHLAHVVDDHLMETDIVIRGEEWLSSTPKHLLLFEYFGWQAPRYAHVPLLLNKDKSKLSKRQNDVAAEDYMTQGYLPEAMLNFLALLGWNPGTTQELFSLEELIEQFSLERIQKAGAVFDPERLLWFQGQWMRRFSLDEFLERILPAVSHVYPQAANDARLAERAALIQERITFINEAPEMLSYFYTEPEVNMDIIANPKQKVDAADVPKYLQMLIDTLEGIDEKSWNADYLKETLLAAVEKNGVKNGQLLWPLRAVLTGLPFSPGAFEVAAALDKETVLKRVKHALHVSTSL